MAPNMTALTNIHLHCLMKRDGVDRMLPFAKRDISEWSSKYESKKIN